MKYLSAMVIAALTLLGASAARSVEIKYEGTLALPSTTVTGSVGGFGYTREIANDLDLWSFVARAGDLITIRGTRIDAALDPTLDLFFGKTTADDSLFRTGQSWGGLQFLATSDDITEPPAGPFGDPLLTFLAPSNGNYTIVIGGSGSDDEGPYRYSLSLLAVQAVPEPTSALLMLAGIAGIRWARTRKQRARQQDFNV